MSNLALARYNIKGFPPVIVILLYLYINKINSNKKINFFLDFKLKIDSIAV